MTLIELKQAFNIERILTIDYETWYSDEYTLRKLTTTCYIRDPRFKAHLVGIQYDDEPHARWIPHDDIPAFFATVDWDAVGLVCHNTAFDGLITTHHYARKPRVWFDTLSMARPLVGSDVGNGLDEVAKHYGFAGKIRRENLEATKGIRDLTEAHESGLGEYCCDDVQDTFAIFKAMVEEDGFPLDELRLIDATLRMYCEPILEVDIALAKEALKDAQDEKRRVVLGAADVLGLSQVPWFAQYPEEIRLQKCLDELGSTPKFAQALEHYGVQVPMKMGKKGIIPALSKGDQAFLQLREHDDPDVRRLVEARIEAKSTIEESKAATLLRHAKPRLPILLNYCRAHTFRWSGGDSLNPQNFPRGSKLRRALRAPKGQVVVVVDASQIEARVCRWVAGAEDALEIFRLSDAGLGKDPYCLAAENFYGRPIVKGVDDQERRMGKEAELGFQFGMAGEKFAHRLAIAAKPIYLKIEDAEQMKRIWRLRNPSIVALWRYLGTMLRAMTRGEEVEFGPLRFWGDLTGQMAGVDMPNGLALLYPQLRVQYNAETGRIGDVSYISSKDGTRSKIYGGLFTENLVQSLARIITGGHLLQIAERYRVVTSTHDEVVFLALKAKAEEALKFAIDTMRVPPVWCSDMPLNAEGGFDVCYSK